jgi:hydroxymethylbilane synthase
VPIPCCTEAVVCGRIAKSCAVITTTALLASLRVAGRRVAVIGDGIDALAATHVLAEAGADVCDTLDGAVLAVVVTGDPSSDAEAAAEALAAGVPVVDLLASASLGELQVGVDPGGSPKAFAARIARDLHDRFDGYDRAARVLAHANTYLGAIISPDEAAPILRQLSELPIAELAAMDAIQMEHLAEDLVERHTTGAPDPDVTHAAVCASRASALALTQTRAVAARLAERGIATTILNVTTTGDRVTDRPLNAIGSENVFVTELELALRERRADYAVHSCKDLPSRLADDMTLVAISKREDARDAYCSERYPTFADLPAGARVGTSSPRRRAQLQALRDDLQYDDVRGNVDTRLRKLREGEYDAIVLAMAGLNRLKVRATHTVPFPVEELVPAAAQGALAIEMRAEPSPLAAELRAAVNDDATERCVAAERAALRALRAGCNAPIGIHARYDGEQMHVALRSFVGDRLRVSLETETVATVAEAEALGARAARGILEEGMP